MKDIQTTKKGKKKKSKSKKGALRKGGVGCKERERRVGDGTGRI